MCGYDALRDDAVDDDDDADGVGGADDDLRLRYSWRIKSRLCHVRVVTAMGTIPGVKLCYNPINHQLETHHMR